MVSVVEQVESEVEIPEVRDIRPEGASHDVPNLYDGPHDFDTEQMPTKEELFKMQEEDQYIQKIIRARPDLHPLINGLYLSDLWDFDFRFNLFHY